jgi:hypothetical protein
MTVTLLSITRPLTVKEKQGLVALITRRCQYKTKDKVRVFFNRDNPTIVKTLGRYNADRFIIVPAVRYVAGQDECVELKHIRSLITDRERSPCL